MLEILKFLLETSSQMGGHVSKDWRVYRKQSAGICYTMNFGLLRKILWERLLNLLVH